MVGLYLVDIPKEKDAVSDLLETPLVNLGFKNTIGVGVLITTSEISTESESTTIRAVNSRFSRLHQSGNDAKINCKSTQPLSEIKIATSDEKCFG